MAICGASLSGCKSWMARWMLFASAMAAWALGEIGSRRAVAALRSALNDPDPQVRREAALALGKLKATEVRLELAERLKTDRSDQVRVAAQMALQQLSQ